MIGMRTAAEIAPQALSSIVISGIPPSLISTSRAMVGFWERVAQHITRYLAPLIRKFVRLISLYRFYMM